LKIAGDPVVQLYCHCDDCQVAQAAACTSDSPRYLQATGFLLAPEGKILNAVYSSGPLARLVAEDVIGMVAYLKSKA
jgi:hypothetical protein